MAEGLVLHEYPASGNCYKVRLTAAHLGMGLERREYDILKGETRTPEFLEKVNANGRIPVLQVGDRFIPESNAACFFLADGTSLVPEDRFERAAMLGWQFWERYSHEPNVATMRFWLGFLGEEKLSAQQRAQIPAKRAAGEAALKLMDRHLAGRPFLVGDRLSPMRTMALRSVIRIESSGSKLGRPSGKTSGIRTWLKPSRTSPKATRRRFSLHMGGC